MLQTQVQYWANRENARHNLATESATLTDLARRQLEVNAQIKYWQGQLKELTRHNKATEKLTKSEIKTKIMQAEAALKQAEIAERDLANRAKSAQASLNSSLANLSQASTAEKNLANLAKTADASLLNAETAAANAPYQQGAWAAESAKTGAEAQSAKKAAENWYGVNYGVPLLNAAAKIFSSTK